MCISFCFIYEQKFVRILPHCKKINCWIRPRYYVHFIAYALKRPHYPTYEITFAETQGVSWRKRLEPRTIINKTINRLPVAKFNKMI